MAKCNAFLIKIGILIVLSSLIINAFVFNVESTEEMPDCGAYVNLDNINLKISQISEKIHINDNSNWGEAKNAGICTGEGTYSNPYVIEDLVIFGGSSGSCILIENSSVYFRIENCTVYNSWHNAGIQLSNVQNSLLIKNNCSENDYGIYLTSSNNNTVSENKISRNYYGIVLEDSNNNTISENDVSRNSGGIELLYSNYNTIIGNIVNNNDIDGIELLYSNYNTILGNTASYNFNYGIRLGHSDNNRIVANTLIGNRPGCWYENQCEGNLFIYNNCQRSIVGNIRHFLPITIIIFLLSIISILIYNKIKRKI